MAAAVEGWGRHSLRNAELVGRGAASGLLLVSAPAPHRGMRSRRRPGRGGAAQGNSRVVCCTLMSAACSASRGHRSELQLVDDRHVNESAARPGRRGGQQRPRAAGGASPQVVRPGGHRFFRETPPARPGAAAEHLEMEHGHRFALAAWFRGPHFKPPSPPTLTRALSACPPRLARRSGEQPHRPREAAWSGWSERLEAHPSAPFSSFSFPLGG